MVKTISLNDQKIVKKSISITELAQPENAYLDNSKTKIRAWFFTLNNYSECTIENLLWDLKEKGKSWAIQCEVAPTTGTPHLQGIVWWKNPRSFGGMTKLLPRAKLFRHPKAKDINAAVYCTKVETSTGRKWTHNIEWLLKLANKTQSHVFKFKPDSKAKALINRLTRDEESADDQTIDWMRLQVMMMEQEIAWITRKMTH